MSLVNLKNFTNKELPIDEFFIVEKRVNKTLTLKNNFFTSHFTIKEYPYSCSVSFFINISKEKHQETDIKEFFYLAQYFDLIPEKIIDIIKNKIQKEKGTFFSNSFEISNKKDDGAGLYFILKSTEHFSYLESINCTFFLEDYFLQHRDKCKLPLLINIEKGTLFRKENEDLIDYLELNFKK
jgi:hypothetical protein